MVRSISLRRGEAAAWKSICRRDVDGAALRGSSYGFVG